MNDDNLPPDSPNNPGEVPTTESPSADTPSAGTTAAAATTPSAPPHGSPSATPWPAPSPAPSSATPTGHFLVPKWLAVVAACVVLVGAGFAIGWIAAPGGGSDSSSAAARRFPGVLPFGGGQGPSSGGAQTSGVYLGVATESSTNPPGARIARVASGSPAETAGLKTADVVTKINDQSVDGPAQLAQRVRAHKVGDEVTVVYTRDNKSATVKVKLGDRSTRQD